MILYVLRHAEAVEMTADLRDENRFLTDDGVKAVASIGEKMADMGKMPRLVITSPLVRAVQCAQTISGYARKSRVVVTDLLKNGADLATLREFIVNSAEEKRVMVVGHEPLLGNLVASLLQLAEPFPLKKGGCVALEIDVDGKEQPARFDFYLKPGKAPIASLKKALAVRDKSEPGGSIVMKVKGAAQKKVKTTETKGKVSDKSAKTAVKSVKAAVKGVKLADKKVKLADKKVKAADKKVQVADKKVKAADSKVKAAGNKPHLSKSNAKASVTSRPGKKARTHSNPSV